MLIGVRLVGRESRCLCVVNPRAEAGWQTASHGMPGASYAESASPQPAADTACFSAVAST